MSLDRQRQPDQQPRRFDRLKATALIVTTLSPFALIATGCAGDSKYPYYNRTKSASKFLANRFKKNEVAQCAGSAIVKYNGHVRLSPDASEDKNIAEKETAAAKHGDLKLVAPERLQLDTAEISRNWYVAQGFDGETVYVNGTALVKGSIDLGCEAEPLTDVVTGKLVEFDT